MPQTPMKEVVGNLVLVRLLALSRRKPTRAEVKKSLEPFFAHRGTAGEWNTLWDEAFQSLEASGLITPRPYALTDRGHKQALDFLGLDTLPAQADWRTLKKTYLVARAFDLPAHAQEVRNRLATAEGLRAQLLKKHYSLTTEQLPTLKQATDALAWQVMHVDTDQPFTLKAVLAVLLNRLLEVETKLDLDQLQRQLPARVVGARKSDAEELRLATIRRWLDSQACGSTPSFDLERFAARVLDAARSSPTGRFGEHKVFIAHVWRRLREQQAFPGMDVLEFKQRLTEANHAGLLTLSWADLVEAMDPVDVKDSATHYLNATFHFVQIG